MGLTVDHLAVLTRGQKKAPARVRSGRAARARGEGHETALDAQHAAYARAGLAYIARVPTPMRVLGAVSGGVCRAAFAARSTVDYLGTMRGGRAVALELKARAGKRLAAADLPEHQWAALRAVQRLGGLALVLVILDDGAWVARVECLDADAAERGAKSWTIADMDRCGGRLRGLDWMAAFGAAGGAL